MSRIWEIREKTRSFKIFPLILVYEKAHWYQCVALAELVWMHCVYFFILNFVEEISAKYCENPTSGFALRPNILLNTQHKVPIRKNVISETIPIIGTRLFELVFGHNSEALLYPITQHKVPIGKNVISETNYQLAPGCLSWFGIQYCRLYIVHYLRFWGGGIIEAKMDHRAHRKGDSNAQVTSRNFIPDCLSWFGTRNI